jgi:hypothetical protein
MARNPGRNRVFALLIAAVFAILAAGPTTAAERSSGMRVVDRWTYDSPADADPNAGIVPGSLILNSEKRRAFQIFKLTGVRTLIRIIDLDTMKTLAEHVHSINFATSRGYKLTQYMHGLDPDTNTLYLPFNNSSGLFDGVAVIDGTTAKEVARFSRTAALDPSRMVTLSETPPNGADDVALCTSQACQPQTFGVAPTVTGMEFIPSFVSGSKPKLLMLWADAAVATTDGNVFLAWATQWDATTGKQDFSYRIQACSVRLPSGSASQYALSIFQARLGAGIYVGCNGPGATGQVVRIRLDGNGQPSGEDTYPGPQSVQDVFADRLTDRLIFRVVTFTGESYWVFNGGASTYAGVVGATLNNALTRTGVDELNGRLYIMAPSSSRGNETQQAALLTSDFRRSPAPQVTLHPDVFLPNVDLQLLVDTHHPSGKPRIFAHISETNYYEIIEDSNPPSFDEPLTNLDRFTVDAAEEEGVTDANYTGTGHGYGLRALLAGGFQGAVPVGADASGVTLRYLASQQKSPCATPDREIRMGSVPFATLANNLASAESSAASTEPGTISDLREPTGRCHPHPSAPRALPEDDDSDGQSNADEIAGSEWPFFAAVCSGDSQDERVTTLRPLDRRPVPENAQTTPITGTPADGATPDQLPVPENLPTTGTPADGVVRQPRQTPVTLEDNRASVDCRLSEANATATANGGALDVQDLPPGVDSLSVGAVGSFTDLRRGDGGGLIAETISYARNISIGERISIDVAYSRAVAFAGGRPGTAGTILERRICGVSIPEIKGRYSVIPIDTPAGRYPPDPDPVPVGDPLYDATQGTTLPDGSDGVSYPIGNVDPLNDSTDDQNIDGAVAACAEAPVSQANATPLGQRPFLEALNRVLGARGRAYIPDPDPELRQGSPGGYLASIQKDRFQQIGARAVSNDASTQVPALEIQLYNDDPYFGRGRQLFQFAGVDASVTYGIYLLSPDLTTPVDDPNDDLPPFDVTDDLPPLTGGPTLPPIDSGLPPTPTAPPATGVFAPVTYVYRGVSFLARSWQDAALAGSVLIMLAGPLVLLARRRALRTLV